MTIELHTYCPRSVSLQVTRSVEAYYSQDRNHGSQVYRLTDDYLNLSSITYTFNEDLEAPAMLKKDGVYYFFGSYLTGMS
jgi:hypothetical protein